MKEITYQQKAIDELVDKTIELLNYKGSRKKLVLKAPTGAGKTVMASEALDRLVLTLPNHPTSDVRDVAYIWIAPNKLHEQSYMKMRNYFRERRSLQPKMFDEIDRTTLGALKMGEILFLNWESINKEKNVIVRESENCASIFDVVRRTKEEGRNIILIIDEEHMSAGKNAPKANNVLRRIDAKVEIRISATPTTVSQDAFVNIPHEKVIEAGMIKQKIMLNPALVTQDSDTSLNQMLVRTSLAKRDELAACYQRLGVDINPLLLIQLPNDASDKLNMDEQRLVDEIKQYLNAVHGINEDNNKLAIWLSGEKSNLAGIEKPNNLVEVLLFKQAIALGWDCPRAAVLLIFRKLESFQFTVQTVGRIMRMPEQHFYTEGALNVGYVYTNLNRDMIQIVADNMDYIAQPIVSRRQSELKNVSLTSHYVTRPNAERNVVSYSFKKVLRDTFDEMWFRNTRQLVLSFVPFGDENEDEMTGSVYEPGFGGLGGEVEHNRGVAEKMGLNLNVKNIVIDIPKDIVLTEVQQGTVKLGSPNRLKHVRREGELRIIFNDFCLGLLGSHFKKDGVANLSSYVLEYVGEAFGMMEVDAMKVILSKQNKDKFANVISRALDTYLDMINKKRQEQRGKNFGTRTWEVPEERCYDDAHNKTLKGAKHHALQPYVRFNHASNPEVMFEEFLEKNGAYIDWWYKNGNAGSEHFAIRYTPAGVEDGSEDLFYPDYIIRMRNGHVYIFDTKTPDSDIDAPAKHNALIDYMKAEKKDKKLSGGIIINDNGIWRYCPMHITNTTDLTNWNMFDPQNA